MIVKWSLRGARIAEVRSHCIVTVERRAPHICGLLAMGGVRCDSSCCSVLAVFFWRPAVFSLPSHFWAMRSHFRRCDYSRRHPRCAHAALCQPRANLRVPVDPFRPVHQDLRDYRRIASQGPAHQATLPNRHAGAWALGGVLAVAGEVALLLLAIARWADVDFGPLDYASTMRVVVPGVTLTALGFQTVLSSFFMGILRMGRR